MIASSIFSLLPSSVGDGAGLGDLKAWLLREKYYVKAPAQARTIALFEATQGELGAAFRRDYALISATSVETFIELRRKLRSERALAWAMIKAYYSSYFAAHAVMRLHGWASLWAESPQVASVKRVAGLWIGIADELPQRGGWRLSPIAGLTGVQVVGSGASVGGSHEHFWQIFCAFLEDVEQRIVASSSLIPSAVTTSILRIQALRAYLETGQFVRTRHEINYKRGHGVWFPFEMPSYDYRFSLRLQARLSAADAELPEDFSRLSELDRAAAACRGLVALNVELLRTLHQRYPSTTDDLRVGALRLLIQAKAL
jgi:hypothetical protein